MSIADSHDEMEKLILESRATLRTIPTASQEVFDRVEQFIRTYSRLTTKPTSAALLYHQLRSPAPAFREIGSELIVGRLSKSERNPHGADLSISDALLSRRHFSIRLSEDFYVLRDLDSQNGTYLNDDPTRVNEKVLKAGDLIRAGASLFLFTGTPVVNAA